MDGGWHYEVGGDFRFRRPSGDFSPWVGTGSQAGFHLPTKGRLKSNFWTGVGEPAHLGPGGLAGAIPSLTPFWGVHWPSTDGYAPDRLRGSWNRPHCIRSWHRAPFEQVPTSPVRWSVDWRCQETLAPPTDEQRLSPSIFFNFAGSQLHTVASAEQAARKATQPSGPFCLSLGLKAGGLADPRAAETLAG